MLERLAEGTRARKVLVLVSDGGDNASTATLNQVLDRARASNAAIYTIGIYDDDDLDRNPRVLRSIAAATGGERYLPRSAGPLLETCPSTSRAKSAAATPSGMSRRIATGRFTVCASTSQDETSAG
jgi:hypothetical protein